MHERKRRVLPALTGMAVLAMLITGCQGDPEPSATETSDSPSASATASASASVTPTAPSTPEPSPASSLGPAANIPVPEKPALADENTAEGLEAFTEYWFELFSYGYETNDWEPFEAVTDSRCETCSNVVSAVKGVYAGGGWIEGANSSITSFVSDFETNTEGSVGALVEVQQGSSTIYLQSGEVDDQSAEGEPEFRATFNAFIEGRWVMLDFGAPEGTE